ncbi:MAG: glycosyltransferase family 2 protein, partial [Bacteroidota bacterium]|nr:glycosyltransferase family 2 protein [Bacteroidota bacterium]
PTLNRYEYLKDVFEDLKLQTYKNFETIVVDQTDNPDKQFYDSFDIDKKVIFQEGKGQWLARNEAVRVAKGDLLLFYDDDSRVGSDWIAEHIKALDFFQADISAGVSFSKVGGEIPVNYSFFRWADQFDSGNALVKREVFKQIGLFDRQFDKMRMGDGEFGLRAYMNGFKSISHPYASRLHLKVSSGGLRQMGSWDAFRTSKLFSPKPIPSVLYFYRTYFPGSYVNNALVLGVLPSLIPYKFKKNKLVYPFGILMAVLFLPILAIQVAKSWSQSGKMMKEGNKIEFIN